jgi:hypothetical protein
MKNINVAYVKLNLKYEIIDHNHYFIDFFEIVPTQILGKNIIQINSNIHKQIHLKLDQLVGNQKKSLLVFRNHKLSNVEEPLVTALYITITKDDEAISICMTNWLNWIRQLNHSINNNYILISNMNESKYRKKISQLLEIYWFKALSPLLMHIPNAFIGMINSWAFFDILKLFNNKRGENIFSKDYNRDMVSRIRHYIKRRKDFMAHIDVIDILKDDSLINLEYNNELFIPHSILNEDIILTINEDKLLENFLALAISQDRTTKMKL